MYSLGSLGKQYVLKKNISEFLKPYYANNSENIHCFKFPASRGSCYAVAQQAFIHIAVAGSCYRSHFMERYCRKVWRSICTFFLYHHWPRSNRSNGIFQ